MKLSSSIEDYRINVGDYASAPGKPYGAFLIPGPCGQKLTVMFHDGATTGWEHASVSTKKRAPNWQEMCFVKNLFWGEEECVVEFHPPRSQYINNYSVVLHMWRCKNKEFPMPPSILVGFKELGTIA